MDFMLCHDSWSLGSFYFAGIILAISAIGQHNENNANNPDKQILIDVLSGASAGGMTAAMLTQKLLYDKNALKGATQNILYQAWVEKVDIEPLLSDQFNDDPKRSVLSSNFIDHMATDILISRYDNANPPQKRHQAAAKEIALGLAMSNLNGVDYAVDAFKNAYLDDETGQFVQTRFQDSFTRLMGQEQDARYIWIDVKNAARGCGAFPTAFAPVKLERNYNEPDYFGKAKAFATTAFTYVDGGTFNNYPLGTAKHLVNQIDTDPLDHKTRFYLYVSPNSKVSSKLELDGETASILSTSIAISRAIFNQARFQDWIMTSKYNHLLDQFSDRAQALGEHFLTLPRHEFNALESAYDVLLTHIFDFEQTRDQKTELHALYAKFEKSPIAQEIKSVQGELGLQIWLKALHVLEAGGRLHDKDHMPIYTITAKSEELASDGLFAFVGFLDRKFREHDYNVGRKKARAFLTNLKAANATEKGQVEHHLPLTDFVFNEPIPELEDLGGATLADVKFVDKEAKKFLKI